MSSSTDLENDDNGTVDSEDEPFSEVGEVGDTEVEPVCDCVHGFPCLY